MFNFLKLWALVLVAFVVIACGGGGGNPGASVATTTVTSTVTVVVDTATLKVTDFVLYTDKNILKNSGSDKVIVSAVALDASRNIVVGSIVKMTVDQNAVMTPMGDPVTDVAGSYAGQVTIGSDKTDRTLTVQATINGIVKRTSIKITGSKLTLQISPTNPLAGKPIGLTANLVDAAGNAIPNVKLTLGGTIPALQGVNIVTDLSGSGTTTVAAPTASGAYTINGSGSGIVSSDYAIQVVPSTAISIPPATIPSGATPSLAASPNVLAVNSPNTSTNKSTLRFLFLDASNKPVSNVRVRFDDMTTGLPTVGASITTGTQTVYTDASGLALSQYISGQNTSPTNGVSIRACYSSVDFISITDCPNAVLSTLTVAGQALAVSIGDDNLLANGGGTYIKKFVVTVADAAGKPVPNAPVDISVDLSHYGKGAYSYRRQIVPALNASVSQGIVNSVDVNGVTSTYTVRAWCANEDLNRNGFVDAGENIDSSVDGNNQPTLQPRKSDLLISYADPAVTTTNSSGILQIKVEYSQRFATWLAYTIRVTANVGGSQGTNERQFVTDFIVGDDVNGSFLNPPYGYNACNIAN